MSNKLVKLMITTFIITYFAWEVLYFSIGEGFVLGISIYFSATFLFGWYRQTALSTRFFGKPGLRVYLFLLPFIPVILYLLTLTSVASWDVINVMPYIGMYLVLGIAWLSLTFSGMLLFWSFSYQDDALLGKNRAALALLTGAMIGVSLIYAGANIGDGPGWWTIVFAGGLGTLSWLLLGALINKLTGIIERITIDHENGSGIRFASYLIASGLILARASAGDWTSFSVTILEFLAGWPVLPLVAMMILFELLLFKNQENDAEDAYRNVKSMIAVGIYLLYALYIVILLPALF